MAHRTGLLHWYLILALLGDFPRLNQVPCLCSMANAAASMTVSPLRCTSSSYRSFVGSASQLAHIRWYTASHR